MMLKTNKKSPLTPFRMAKQMENPFIENLATGTCTLPMPMCQRILILLHGLCGQALSKGQATTLETLNLATKIRAAQIPDNYKVYIYIYNIYIKQIKSLL